MIRLICKEMASDYDGKTHQLLKTFDVDLPEVEKWLEVKVGYAQSGSRQIIGAEIITNERDGYNEKI